jgi:Fe-S-cluster containining protein
MSFVCLRCGACCRWEGAVKLIGDEPDKIAEFLGVAVEDFIRDHTTITPDRQHLSLLSKADGSCEYLGDEGCLINPVKPLQCREFPEKWNFPGWENECASGRQTKLKHGNQIK